MLISLAWIGRHVDLAGVDLDALAERFTLTVAEIDGVKRTEAAPRIVVGAVLSAELIPGTHLRSCEVDTGDRRRSIVCGASNVAAGQYVAVALPGARVGDLVIEERDLRGVRSEGMICSESELGVGSGGSGILVLDGSPTPGRLLRELVALEDTVIEIDNKSLTHRPDLWGHRGIAREVAALLDRPLTPVFYAATLEAASSETPPTGALGAGTSGGPAEIRSFEVVNDAPDGCRCYCAVPLAGVRVGSSPLWLRVLLHRVGIRPVNNVVDATNFVMLDLGNPLHAFDRSKLRGDCIRVREALPAEKFTTLDGVEHALEPQDLVIADAEQSVALAGVMGGANSEIEDGTTEVLLEAACFDPARVRLTSQRLGIRTAASARFEKGLDPALPEVAIRAGVRLLAELVPGVRAGPLVSQAAPQPQPRVIELRMRQVRRRLGVELTADAVKQTLRALEFTLGARSAGVNDDSLLVTVPSFRATKDITEEIDLIEEIGRYYNYNNIPPAAPAVLLGKPPANSKKQLQHAVRSYLTQAAGFDEVISYSFAVEPFLDRIASRPAQCRELRNPISQEMAGLRTELATGLLLVLERNAAEFPELGVFEIGRVFPPLTGAESASPDGQVAQPRFLGALLADRAARHAEDFALFLRLKSILEGLLPAIGRPELSVEAGGVIHPWAHPVRQARVGCGGVLLGYLAEVHPVTLSNLETSHPAALFEIDLDALGEVPRLPGSYSPLPRFPAVFRDFAVVVEERVSAREVQAAMQAASALVTSIDFQSVYRGPGIPEGAKCLAWSVTLRHADHTLGEGEVRTLEETLWRVLETSVGGKRR